MGRQFQPLHFHDFLLSQGLLPRGPMRQAVMQDFIPQEKGPAASR